MTKGKLDYWQDIETYEKYTFDSEEGKKRIEEMEKYFAEFKNFLGKRVLDIACGAGLFSFWLEQKGYEMVGVDINKKMIELALKTKKKYKFKSQFLLSDAANVKLEGKFDNAIIFGNTLFSLSPKTFVHVIRNVKKHLKENGYVIINYRSLLEKLVNKEWKDIYFDSERIASFNLRYDDSQAGITKLYVDLTGEKLPTKETFYAWSTGFLEAIMEALGFVLVKRIKTEVSMCEVMDIYQMKLND
jgi:2-polyprenyl-3-methyl-5-hydroxy-6-metoxy-1,4-benzoquinol methylase